MRTSRNARRAGERRGVPGARDLRGPRHFLGSGCLHSLLLLLLNWSGRPHSSIGECAVPPHPPNRGTGGIWARNRDRQCPFGPPVGRAATVPSPARCWPAWITGGDQAAQPPPRFSGSGCRARRRGSPAGTAPDTRGGTLRAGRPILIEAGEGWRRPLRSPGGRAAAEFVGGGLAPFLLVGAS